MLEPFSLFLLFSREIFGHLFLTQEFFRCLTIRITFREFNSLFNLKGSTLLFPLSIATEIQFWSYVFIALLFLPLFELGLSLLCQGLDPQIICHQNHEPTLESAVSRTWSLKLSFIYFIFPQQEKIDSCAVQFTHLIGFLNRSRGVSGVSC